MSNNTFLATFDVLRVLAFGSISGTYAKLGGAFAFPMRIIEIYNGCNTDMIFSIDGSNDNGIIPSGKTVDYNISAAHFGGFPYALSKGTQIWIKQVSAPDSGSVYLTCVYGRDTS